jgi:HlyD family secretion protein
MTAAAATLPGTPAKATLGDCRSLMRVGYGAILLTFGAFGGWAAIAPLDSAAIANAQVAVSSDRKPIQHLEGGMLREVLIDETQRVVAGQILFRLQPIQAQANADAARKATIGALAQEARLLAERDQKSSINWPIELSLRRTDPEMAGIIADQEKQFAERRRSIESQVAIQTSRIEQTNRDIGGKLSRERSLAQQIDSLRVDVSKFADLADRGYFARSKVTSMQRDLYRLEGDRDGLKGDISRAEETIAESRQQIKVIQQQRVEEAAQQLGDVRSKLSELREKSTVTADALARMEVRAPRAGIIQSIKVHSVGEVIKPGDTLAELVTPEEGLIMTAQVQPSDIDSVQANAKAEIRFPAFAARQRVATRGEVLTIASDLTFDPNTKQSYYVARVRIDADTLPKELQGKLVPGMPASVLITTGERTMLTYIVGPLIERITRTMRER